MTNLMSTDDSKFNYPQVQEKKSTASTADVHSRMSQVAIANTSLLWCLYKKSNNSTKASFHHFQTAILTMLVHGHETLALLKQETAADWGEIYYTDFCGANSLLIGVSNETHQRKHGPIRSGMT